MSNYLDAAAQLVRTAAAGHERNKDWAGVESAARVFALLAAIDKGLLPQSLAEDIAGQLPKAGDWS